MSEVDSGMRTSYEVEHRNKEGKLIYREASIMLPTLPEAPPAPTCPDSKCISNYKKELDEWGAECKKKADLFSLIAQYHSARARYCTNHRNDQIEEKYRTGDPSPESEEQVKAEIKKLGR